MEGTCRLCKKDSQLILSHVIPNSFIKRAKKEENCNQILSSFRNGVSQDGYKLYFLCNDCEQLFSKYEKNFKEKVYDVLEKDIKSDIDPSYVSIEKYFVLSIAWRYMQAQLEKTDSKIDKKINKADEWRKLLLNEDHAGIDTIQIFIIPVERIPQIIGKSYGRTTYTGAFGLFCWNHKDFKSVFIQISSLLLICPFEGRLIGMNDFLVERLSHSNKTCTEIPQYFLQYYWENVENYLKLRIKNEK